MPKLACGAAGPTRKFKAHVDIQLFHYSVEDGVRGNIFADDFGADVVLKTGTSGKLVQCKHTKHVKYDGYSAILEVHSAQPKYSLELNINIETLIFVTNAKILSEETKKIAEQYNVQIYS